MNDVRFVKVQAIGNNFVLVHADAFVSDTDLIAFVKDACEARFGIGSDGLLVVAPPLRCPTEVVHLRMFNPDGTEDFCGNGLRCAAHYAREMGWVGEQFALEHFGRVVPSWIGPDGICTELGSASFDPAKVPLYEGAEEVFGAELVVGGETLRISSVTTGSTHTVVWVDDLPGDARFFDLSPKIEHHPWFPDRTSVIWTKADDQRNLRIRIWERGVGETSGCGSGSSAAAATHFRANGLGGSISVHNPGGTLEVSMPTWDGPITVKGEAQIVFRGAWPGPTCSAD